jgi:hypothetical protein
LNLGAEAGDGVVVGVGVEAGAAGVGDAAVGVGDSAGGFLAGGVPVGDGAGDRSGLGHLTGIARGGTTTRHTFTRTINVVVLHALRQELMQSVFPPRVS